MSRKRRNTSSESEGSPIPKRRQISYSASSDESENESREQPTLNTTYGQTGAFPGVQATHESEVFYGPASDGLEYLRMVRTEARTVPSTLSSQMVQENANPFEGTDVPNEPSWRSHDFYNDEAIVARPMVGTATIPSRYSTIQQLWYSKLLQRFRWAQKQHRRRRLLSDPASRSQRAIRENGPVGVPAIELICDANKSSSFGMLKDLTEAVDSMHRKDTLQSILQVGRMTWSVLVCLDELETLGSEEVAVVRELGKAATIAYGRLHAVSNGHSATEYDDVVEKACNAASMVSDTIITVVGEIFGQKDLLEDRVAWES